MRRQATVHGQFAQHVEPVGEIGGVGRCIVGAELVRVDPQHRAVVPLALVGKLGGIGGRHCHDVVVIVRVTILVPALPDRDVEGRHLVPPELLLAAHGPDQQAFARDFEMVIGAAGQQLCDGLYQLPGADTEKNEAEQREQVDQPQPARRPSFVEPCEAGCHRDPDDGKANEENGECNAK